MSKAGILIAATTVLLLAQATAAGVAFWLREESARELAAAAAHAAELRRRAAEPPPVPAVESAAPGSRWRLHDGNDVPAVMQLLEAICDGEGVAVEGIKAVTTNAPGRQSFVLAVRGAPEAVCALLAALEQHERLLVVENGRVRPGADGTIAAELGIAASFCGGGR
jgi:hypothetical protein